MSDALLLGLLEQQSIANYETETKPATPALTPEPTAFSTAPINQVELTESTAPETQVQQESTPSLARTSTPISPKVEKFSHIMDEPWSIERAVSKIPEYQPANSCANCMYSTWNPATGIPCCAYYKTEIVSSYWCPKYTHPSEMVPEEEEVEDDDDGEMYTDAAAQKFNDINIYSQALEAAKEHFADLTTDTAQLWILRKYGQLYKEAHGTTDGALSS